MRTCWLEIDLRQIRENLRVVKRYVSNSKKVIAVIKTNGYGHGIVEVGRYIESCGVDYFGVVTIDEAKKLRDNGITIPILLLSPFSMDDVEYAVENDISLSVTDDNFPEIFSGRKIGKKKKLKLHIQINTNMNRHGVSDYKLNSIYHYIMKHEEFELTGIYSNSSAVSTVKDELRNFINSLASIEEFSSKI